MAKPNLRVNGFDYETYVSKTEPFDEALDRKVWAVESERVQWEATLAELRRKTPGQIREREEDLEARRAKVEWLPEGEDEEREPSRLRIAAIELGTEQPADLLQRSNNRASCLRHHGTKRSKQRFPRWLPTCRKWCRSVNAVCQSVVPL